MSLQAGDKFCHDAWKLICDISRQSFQVPDSKTQPLLSWELISFAIFADCIHQPRQMLSDFINQRHLSSGTLCCQDRDKTTQRYEAMAKSSGRGLCDGKRAQPLITFHVLLGPQVLYDRLGITLVERGESFYNDMIPPLVQLSRTAADSRTAAHPLIASGIFIQRLKSQRITASSPPPPSPSKHSRRILERKCVDPYTGNVNGDKV